MTDLGCHYGPWKALNAGYKYDVGHRRILSILSLQPKCEMGILFFLSSAMYLGMWRLLNHCYLPVNTKAVPKVLQSSFLHVNVNPPLSLVSRLHPMDLLLVQILIQTRVEVLPPVEEEWFADELEPWCENQVAIAEHYFQLLCWDVLGISDFVGAGVEGDFCGWLDEEDVVN